MDKYLFTLKITKAQIIIAILAGLFLAVLPIKIFSVGAIDWRVDNFNNYDIGSFKSPNCGSWVVSVGDYLLVTDSDCYDGRCLRNASGTYTAELAGGAGDQVEIGEISFAHKWGEVVDGAKGSSVNIGGGVGTVVEIVQSQSGATKGKIVMVTYGYTLIPIIDVPVKDKWYMFHCEWDLSDALVANRVIRCKVDEGDWTSWYRPRHGNTSATKVKWLTGNVGDGFDEMNYFPIEYRYYPEPGQQITQGLWYLYDIVPRGYYDVPQSHIFTQAFKVQWMAETTILWAWMEKARLTFRDLADMSATTTEKEFEFDEVFHSQDGFLGQGSRAYSFSVDLSGDAMASSTYLVYIDIWYGTMLDWDGKWSEQKIIGYYTFPDPDTGVYPDMPGWLPELPPDYWTDEPSWAMEKLNELKYNFPFGYYFLIQDILEDIEVADDDEFPETVEATFTFSGVSTTVPIFGMGVIYDKYPEMFDTMKSFMAVLVWFMFGFYIYERLIHAEKLIGFNR